MKSDELDGTRWALEYLTLDAVSHMVSGRRIPELAFLDGRLSADDGVNMAAGEYHLDKDRFSASLSLTSALEYPEVQLPEHGLLDHLTKAVSATVHGDFLHLRFDGGELVYRWESDEMPA